MSRESVKYYRMWLLELQLTGRCPIKPYVPECTLEDNTKNCLSLCDGHCKSMTDCLRDRAVVKRYGKRKS